jgi:hypothetical protein
MKIGRNEPCPCGSGKKYKHCCLGRQQEIPVPAPQVLDSMKQRLQEAFDAGQVETIEDANRIAAEIALESNQQGLPEFHGLSPTEMRDLLACGFRSCGAVEIPDRLDADPVAPVVTLFESMVDGIGSGVKATAKGNLPLKLVTTAAEAFYARHPSDSGYQPRLRGEEDFDALHAVRVISDLAGLIHLDRSKYTLTDQYRQLLAEGGMQRLYPVLLQTAAVEFNWAYRDGYDEMPGIQHTAMFTLYLLSRYGNEFRPSTFYEDAYLTAFPMVVNEAEGNSYRSARDTAAGVYTLRTLDRFAAFFGLVERRQNADTTSFGFDLRATPLLADVARFRTAQTCRKA